MPQTSDKAIRWLHCALLVAVVFGLPALIRQGSPGKPRFDKRPVEWLAKKNPECVLIGDSMLETRIDSSVWKKLTDLRCESLSYSGSGSCCWFLALQNIIAAQPHPPKWVIVFFRDRQLTLATYHTEGRYRLRLEAQMRSSEPLVDDILAAAQKTPPRLLERLSIGLYPLQRHRSEGQEKVQSTALDLIAHGSKSEFLRIREAAQKVFDVKNLREDAGVFAEGAEDTMRGLDPEDHDFGNAVEHSFLPPMLRVAHEHGIRLIFFRVKRKPPALAEASPGLPAYIADLRAYLENAGVLFVDETDDPNVSPDFFGRDDHVVETMRGRYTEHFLQRMLPVLTEARP